MDVLFLSRIQFALNIGFHYLYPPISIGLGLMLVIMEGLYLKTKNPKYKEMTHFWIKIFALTFALGVATGLVQSFAFGTNWSRYSRFVGDVFGSALAAEGIFAFFLESGFLGVFYSAGTKWVRNCTISRRFVWRWEPILVRSGFW
jgi:cytochrome d ubiquinol oxidase subunit I